jgi:transposase
MMAPLVLKEGMRAREFRQAARSSHDTRQVRRPMALAAIRDGMSRTEVAKIGGMDHQTLRDWVHADNDHGRDGLINDPSPGRPPKLSDEQKAEIKALFENGPDLATGGVVRWCRTDFARLAKSLFGLTVDKDAIGRLLREFGFSHISQCP